MVPRNPFAPQARVRTGEAPAEDPEAMSGTTKAILIALGVGGLFWVATKVWDASAEEKRLAAKLESLEGDSGERGGSNGNPSVVVVMPPAPVVR